MEIKALVIIVEGIMMIEIKEFGLGYPWSMGFLEDQLLRVHLVIQ